MKIKFETKEMLFSYLYQTKDLDHKALTNRGLYFQGIKFEYEAELEVLQFLEKYQIIEVIGKAVKEGYFKFNVEIEYYLLNTNALKAFKTDSINNPVFQDRFLTLKDVGKILSLTKPSIYRLFNEGKLPYYEVLSQRKVKYSDLMKFMDSKLKHP